MASSTNRRSKSKVSWSPVNLTRDVVQKRIPNNRVINLRLQIISGLLTGDLTDVPETEHQSTAADTATRGTIEGQIDQYMSEFRTMPHDASQWRRSAGILEQTPCIIPAAGATRRGSLKACPHCRRKVRQSPNFAVVSLFLATVSLFSDSVDRALAAPASQAYVERVFSVCGWLTAGRRNQPSHQEPGETGFCENEPRIVVTVMSVDLLTVWLTTYCTTITHVHFFVQYVLLCNMHYKRSDAMLPIALKLKLKLK